MDFSYLLALQNFMSLLFHYTALEIISWLGTMSTNLKSDALNHAEDSFEWKSRYN